ncbi:YqcC family protein [Photobacterium sp. SDRW27]|uniref:YqcC family protein n=1 Tax=Photobacterium obscurum TaxID=2829490 RepID=UPI0022436755|nr:YqcC family protein [Photobacterium obscurum]MCW8331327.1 YqcC family protein [Photobacterium obscurum]
MDRYHQTQLLLDRLETVMRKADIWENESPGAAALASVEPFAIDTLSCSQWLQWIFIPKMHYLVNQKQPLPSQFALAPYVEEAMKGQAGAEAILAVIREFDNLMKMK